MGAGKIILIVVLVIVIIASIAAAVILVGQPQDLRSRAQTPVCTAPTAPSNVALEYPACPDDTACNFTQASCSWDAYSGATNYKLKVTEKDSGTVVKDETLPATTTSSTFTVTQGKTYICEVSVITSCGTGPTGRDELLCEVEGIVQSTPTPSPSATPTASPSATPRPTTVPSPSPLTCGASGCASGVVSCGPGLICIQANNGQSYCGLSQYSSACQQTPGTKACCTAPVASATPVPSRLPESGLGDDLRLLVIGAFGLFAISATSLAWVSLRKARNR